MARINISTHQLIHKRIKSDASMHKTTKTKKKSKTMLQVKQNEQRKIEEANFLVLLATPYLVWLSK